MKKYLPLILLGVGILVVVVVFLFVRGRTKKEPEVMDEETALLEVDLKDRPVISLTPTTDGHYLNLNISKITIDAESLDYELLYQTANDITQGVPGTVSMSGNDNFSAELLLGSESSGKFRYDEGVETGSITLRFRNDEGKLLVKFTSEFHLQTAVSKLTSTDDIFSYTLDEESDEYFVTMHTVGYPDGPGFIPEKGPYGVFSSAEEAIPGTVDLGNNALMWDGSNWNELQGNESSDIGIFVAE